MRWKKWLEKWDMTSLKINAHFHIIKRHGRGCTEFTKLAIVVLNQIVRPFTARWHRLSEHGVFDDPAQCNTKAFRQELTALQTELTRYTQMLGTMAGVEDWTKLEIGD